MPPKSSKSRRQQTITYNLSNANARDAFEEELELEEAELQQRHTAGRARVMGRGSAAFSLAADMPRPLYDRDMCGMHEYPSPQATTDMINLLELFGSSLDREVIESVYVGCNNKFNFAMERLLELAATNDAGAAGVAGCDADADGSSAQQLPSGSSADAAAADSAAATATPVVCYWDILPDDLKRHVFGFLSSRDLARVARTCRDFAGPARSLRTNTRQLQIPTGLGMHGIMTMVASHPNARAVSLRQWAAAPLSDGEFTTLVVALSAGSRSDRRLVPVEALSLKGCRWLSDGQLMAVCHTMQHLKEVDLTDCVGITDAALVALSKYQRLAPEGGDSSSSSSSSYSDGEYDDAQKSTTAIGTAAAAATAAARSPVLQRPIPGRREERRRSSGDGDGDGDDELQFEFDATPAPSVRPKVDGGPAGACGEASGALLDDVRSSAAVAADGDGDGKAQEGEEDMEGGGARASSGSSSSSDDDEEEDEGEAGGGDAAHSRVADPGVEGGREGEEDGVVAMPPSPLGAEVLEGAFKAGLALSPPTAAAAAKPRQGDGNGGAAVNVAPVTGATAAAGGGGSGGGRTRRGTAGSDSASGTPLYGASPVSGSGLMGTSYGAAAAARGGASSPWLYGTSPAGHSTGVAAAAAAAAAAVIGSGSKSWLYGSSPVMGASPYFRTGGSASITHNGWLARAATAATHHHSGRGLMSINLSGCTAISSDGVKALLSAPLPKSCLLQLDISRCPRITRAALILPATSNLCVFRASACHNLHEVIMQLPLTSPLTELHLADCKALSKLHGTWLRHLTASLCFRLVDLDPERWEVGRLEHLNLFGCRHLEWPGLAALLAKCGSSLRHLDVNGCNSVVVADIPAGNDGLRHVDASGCKSLVALRCPSPALATLTLRSCPRLQEVTLESPALTRLDISNCPHLQRLSMPALQQQQHQQQEQEQQHQQQQQGQGSQQQQQQGQGQQALGAGAGSGGGGSGGAGPVSALRAAPICDIYHGPNSKRVFRRSQGTHVQEVSANPAAEVAWYFPDTREQYRIAGDLLIVDSAHTNAALQEARTRTWAAMSEGGRQQFGWPHPGRPRAAEDPQAWNNPAPGPQEPPLDTFCLVVLRVGERYAGALLSACSSTIFIRKCEHGGSCALSVNFFENVSLITSETR
ncbi:hypothetical protein VOLCADRAFT_104802 [Volvox carteri f. nagariensis]|uniref:F-box domain-containing protein n=1 Tax=Volvox carteri f. nagariensis TaxID=3068 RepID=D8TW68_VOLCA|nr:uncharacterized protein VOLCADRAFT_104802 [Volvox carteri f. nagariensis]EFJ48423.1 hypothetical protein VOLCADRAFT_104802 [Volvox carteri f. nagariensis]|eukprot:XP_002950677.1 hypothetical protein VOLCADRAFT_104802 [Volvox carteri f. nagariensis]